ncbi:hypothetical protein N431DRAFT_455629 [Stipitochalara longipes BDJ]|nr:hypothetical protein N431DRAFT_455629 [Stipitochalara longipes BDJ]
MSLSYDAAQLGFPYKAESLATTSSLQTFPTQSIHKVSAGNGRIGNEIRTADLVSQIGKTKSIINNFAGSKRKEPSFRRDPSDEVLDRSFMMKHPEQRPTMRQATTLNVFQPSVSYQAAPLRSTSTRQQQSPDRRYPRGIPPPPPDLPPPTLPYAANNLELHGTEDYFPPHHYQTPPTVPPKIIEFGDVYAVELYTPMMQVPSAPLISEVNRPRDAPLENTQRTPNLERNEGPRNRWAKKDISTGTRILSVSFMKSTISKDRTLGESACQATLLAEFAQNSQKRRRRAFLRSPKSSPTLLKDPRSPKSPPTLLNDPRSRTSSPTLLHDPWALPPPPPPPNESTISSPREYLASPDGIVPRYSQEVELPTGTTNSSRVTRKLGPKQSRVISDLATASRRPRVTGSSKASDENLKLIGRSSIDLGNAPREHSLYYNVTPKADGLYHCPFEDDPKANCTHKPSKDRYNYEYDPAYFILSLKLNTR